MWNYHILIWKCHKVRFRLYNKVKGIEQMNHLSIYKLRKETKKSSGKYVIKASVDNS